LIVPVDSRVRGGYPGSNSFHGRDEMKVAELVALLQAEDQDAEVHFTYNYGDHCRTMVAPAVTSVETGYVKDSAYHGMPKVVDLDDAEDNQDNPAVVILGGV
jgi:hypothetical protein